MCGRAVCGECSAKKITDNRVCDLCYYKAENKRAEERREDQLTSKHASIKTYKKQLLKEKDHLNEIIQKRYNLQKTVRKNFFLCLLRKNRLKKKRKNRKKR